MSKIRIAAVPSYGPCSCGGVFVERVARHGANAGRSFLGCSRYPECAATGGGVPPRLRKPPPAPVFRIVTEVASRDDCPFRRFPDPEGGWGPQVPHCKHPRREQRGGDPWCPDAPNARDDDPTPELTAYPPKCPLRDIDVVSPTPRAPVYTKPKYAHPRYNDLTDDFDDFDDDHSFFGPSREERMSPAELRAERAEAALQREESDITKGGGPCGPLFPDEFGNT